jgi:hypothetical protein
MFRSWTIIRELVLSLAKVMLEHLVKLCPYRLCGGVAACLGVASVLCAVQNETELVVSSSSVPPGTTSTIRSPPRLRRIQQLLASLLGRFTCGEELRLPAEWEAVRGGVGSRAVGKTLVLLQGTEPGILYTLALSLYRLRCRSFKILYRLRWEGLSTKCGWLKADSHIACRAHAVPMPCRAANGLECVVPI